MAIDAELIARSNQRSERANNSKSNAPDSGYNQNNGTGRAGDYRAALQEAKNGSMPSSSGDLRADRMAASRWQSTKEKTNQVAKAALAPARQLMSGLLKSAWINLIPSWGLTLFWIDIHVFLNMVFGKNLFCDLGEEWIPVKSGVSGIIKK